MSFIRESVFNLIYDFQHVLAVDLRTGYVGTGYLTKTMYLDQLTTPHLKGVKAEI